MYARVMDRVISSPWPQRKLFRAALALCRQQLAAEQGGHVPSFWFGLLADVVPNHLLSTEPADFPAEVRARANTPNDVLALHR